MCSASYLHDRQDAQAKGSPRRASWICIIVQHAHLTACNDTARPLQVLSGMLHDTRHKAQCKQTPPRNDYLQMMMQTGCMSSF